ncbi:hypothetical protein B0H13DRAFT_1918898 [Mycena leptocephala]|nr:hypothetical protein B0H13DRAFT_1918898 [Mycena leptocephala]
MSERGRVPRRGTKEETARVEVLSIGLDVVWGSGSDCAIVLGSRARREQGEARGDEGRRLLWKPKSATGCGGDERMKRKREDSTGFASTKPSNGESNPATKHAGDVGRQERGEGGYEVLRVILKSVREERGNVQLKSLVEQRVNTDNDCVQHTMLHAPILAPVSLRPTISTNRLGVFAQLLEPSARVISSIISDAWNLARFVSLLPLDLLSVENSKSSGRVSKDVEIAITKKKKDKPSPPPPPDPESNEVQPRGEDLNINDLRRETSAPWLVSFASGLWKSARNFWPPARLP